MLPSIFSVVVLAAALISGQATQVPSAPLTVVSKRTTQFNEGSQFVVTLSNTSEKAIIGYVIKAERLGANRQVIDSITFSGVTYDPSVERKQPGGTWELMVDARTAPVPQQIAVDLNLIVDYVLFADGTSFGPNILGRGHLVVAEYEGARGERARLRSILREKGADELVRVLNEAEWPKGRAK